MMRRIPWRPLIVAVGVAMLMLGALLGSGTWATVFLTEPGELACETVKTPAGKVTNCSKVEETTPLQRLTTEYKHYALGIGLVQDGSLKHVKVGRAGGPKR